MVVLVVVLLAGEVAGHDPVVVVLLEVMDMHRPSQPLPEQMLWEQMQVAAAVMSQRVAQPSGAEEVGEIRIMLGDFQPLVVVVVAVMVAVVTPEILCAVVMEEGRPRMEAFPVAAAVVAVVMLAPAQEAK